MDEEDLPQAPETSDDSTAAGQLGRVFGASMWMFFAFAVAGGLFWLAMKWLH